MGDTPDKMTEFRRDLQQAVHTKIARAFQDLSPDTYWSGYNVHIEKPELYEGVGQVLDDYTLVSKPSIESIPLMVRVP